MDKINIAGLSLGGGRRDNFFFCLLEYYADSGRWFLKSILQVAEGEGNNILRQWIEDFSITALVVDFPLSNPPCHQCELDCPGIEACSVEEVVSSKERMEALLREASPTSSLSKAFKRRLRRHFLPYWNRPIDVWVWENYYDLLLRYFSMGFDSFGNTSVMLMSRFAYLKRHLTESLSYYETSPQICLLELLRAEIISSRQVLQLNDIERGQSMRMTIAQAIESKLKIFIYDHDIHLMVKNSRAFSSFLLAVAGQRVVLERGGSIPQWCHQSSPNFIVPTF